MKIRTAVSLFFLSLAGLAPAPQAAARPGAALPAAAPAATYPLVVSFISVGAGVPWNSVARFNVVVNEYDQMLGTLERTVVHWGREGEFDVCFTLQGLPGAQVRAEIIEQMLWLGDDDPYIIATENNRCGP
ncbi:hypothetical protein [Tahibacter harae]|uniref:Uncharacterized protein n=1 Tax=Tahibacter harae TaxID=2963937 RepID=A0ABT1QTA0_9GAMM|nr:hypothetical protein [Tahibacter harae]MCQ4165518.1 hypothetical protein [Tahibacter harae]